MPYHVHILWASKTPKVFPANRLASPVAINNADSPVIAGNIITERGFEAVVWGLKDGEYLPFAIPNGPFVDGSLTITGLTDPDGFATQGVIGGYGRTSDDEFRPFQHRLHVGRTQGSGVVYSDEGPTDLPTLIRQPTGPEGDLVSIGSAQAFAIASNGTALPYFAGQSDTANGTQRAAFWQAGVFATDLGTLGGNVSWATAVTGGGDVAGWSQLASGVGHATYFRRFGGYVPQMIDLGTLGGTFSAVAGAAAGLGLNAPTFFVGYADDSAGVARACRFFPFESTRAVMIPGGNRGPGVALAVNSAGICVGRINLKGGDAAFRYDGGTKALVDLNTRLITRPFGRPGPKKPAFHFSEARAINAQGQIIAVGTMGAAQAAFVLTPVPGVTPP